MERYKGIEAHRNHILMVDRLMNEYPWFEVWRLGGEPIIPQVSRFLFHWSQEKFNWLVDNDFPLAPKINSPLGEIQVPWSDFSIFVAMERHDAPTP